MNREVETGASAMARIVRLGQVVISGVDEDWWVIGRFSPFAVPRHPALRSRLLRYTVYGGLLRPARLYIYYFDERVGISK